MTREVARSAAVLSAVALLSGLCGCSHAPDRSSARSSPAATESSSAKSATPTPSRTPHTPGVPTPGSMEKPATSSGPLSKRSFPTPRTLGTAWRYAVDPGDAEEGYAGNGTPALARDPQEVVRTAVPIGCTRPAAMPTPRHALEVDYRLRGAPVIAVRGRFATRAQASTFFAHRLSNLRSCAGRSGSVAIGPLVTALTPLTSFAVVSDRTPRSDPWREVAVLDGSSVVLVAARGRHPLTAPETRRLARLFRS